MTEHASGHVHAGVIRTEDVPHQPGDPEVDVPTVHTGHVMMLDDDNGNCAETSPWGYAPWYPPYAADFVDNVVRFSFQFSDPWGFNGAENDPMEITLASGAQVSIPRSWVAAQAGGAAAALRKMNGVVYPADAGYTMLLDDTNTPNLVAIDNYILKLTQAAAAERYEIAEIVSEFSGAIAALGQASHESGEIIEKVHQFGHAHGQER